MVQMNIAQAGAAQPGLRSILEGNMMQQMSGDAFAMIFQQMMEGMGLQGQDVELLAQLAQNLQKDEEEMGTQLAAEILSIMPNALMTILQTSTEDAPSAMPAHGQTISMADARIQELVSALNTEDADAAAEITKKLTSDEFCTVLSAAWKEEPKSAMELRFQADSLRTAKQMLSSQEEQPVEALDIESLQMDVDARRFLQTDRIIQKDQLLQTNTEEIAKQLKTGILDNVAKGKSEFVIRLKPEGIGEIVVKMSEDKSKVSLSILTSSAQTAKLISNEVAALQNALRPLHAEVQQITVVPENQMSEYTAQSDMTNQNNHFAGQQFANQNQNQSNRPKDQHSVEFGNAMQGKLEDDGLDTYI